MASNDTASPVAELSAPESYNWELAFLVLGDLLASNDGCVSSTALIKELKRKGIENARPLVVELRFFDPESSEERGVQPPTFKFHHLGRSFYSQDKYDQELKKKQDETTKEAEDAGDKASDVEPEEPTVSRTNRQDEARLVRFVKDSLEEIYSSDANEENSSFVFDVHSLRKGGGFENTDLIAVHWRSCNVCELISVEVKLEFNAQVVQQALSYTHFSHRTWIAVPVETDTNLELRERMPILFDYAISRGLGILACRRRKGRRYDVFPIHWPLRNEPDPLGKEEFLERYRDQFEEAGIIDKKDRRRLPRL
ncbi:MAG: hypothetical protein WCC04_17550 [Terriglobales bacterium]